jgi:hypothetical protein
VKKAEMAIVVRKGSKVLVELQELLGCVDHAEVERLVLKVPKASKVQRATKDHRAPAQAVHLGRWVAKEKSEPLESLVQRVTLDLLVHRVCLECLGCLAIVARMARWAGRAFVVLRVTEARRDSQEIVVRMVPRVLVAMSDTVVSRGNLVGLEARASKVRQVFLVKPVLLGGAETLVKTVHRGQWALKEPRASMVTVVSMANRAWLARMAKQEVVALLATQVPKAKQDQWA